MLKIQISALTFSSYQETNAEDFPIKAKPSTLIVYTKFYIYSGTSLPAIQTHCLTNPSMC